MRHSWQPRPEEELESELKDMAAAYNTDTEQVKSMIGEEGMPFFKKDIQLKKVIELLYEKAKVSKVEKKNEVVAEGNIPFSRKLKWLKNMLWGGAALLAYEHVWHGEVVPWFPFLTAAANPEDAAVMLHEMATVGVTMALLVTAAWGCIALAADKIVKRESGVTPAVR